MLKARIITALGIAVIFGSFLFFSSPQVFSLFAVLIVLLAGWEWASLSGVGHPVGKIAYLLLLVAGLAGLAYYAGVYQAALNFENSRLILLVSATWWALALLWVQGYPSSVILWGSSGVRLLMGLMTLLPAWLGLALLIHQSLGVWLIMLVVVIVACADVGAYFSGRAFGKHKLAVQVSPGKTVEGLAGGLLAVLVAVILFLYFSPQQWADRWQWSVVAAVTALASVLGDLLESMVKRHQGVKDSGRILPGHGGVLDRIDSLTAAVPVFTLFYLLLIVR